MNIYEQIAQAFNQVDRRKNGFWMKYGTSVFTDEREDEILLNTMLCVRKFLETKNITSPDEFTFRRGDKLFECKWENDELVYTQGCKK
jgi:hypothetical protein